MKIRRISALLFSMVMYSPLSALGSILNTPIVVPDRFINIHGPLQFTVEYSDKLGYTFDPKYINAIGPYDALSLEFAFGGSEFRGAFSWGHALTENIFFKFSGEYFAQEPDFDFVAGTDSQWVGQGGFGADLHVKAHLAPGFDAYHAGIQYTTAECIGLDSIELPMAGGTNKRKVAGARDYGATIGVMLSPWHAATFDLDIHYDSVDWRNHFSKDKSISGFGLSVAYHQLIGGRWKVYARATDRQPYYDYMGQLLYLLDVAPGSRCEIGGHYKLSGGEVPENKDSRIGLNVFYTWGGNHYTSVRPDYRGDAARGITRELIDYTNEPAVRPPQVLAMPDETVIP